jgi:hypothetical protein
MANDAPMVNLRGPAPKIGFKLRESWKFECQRTDKFTTPQGQVIPVTGSIQGDFENLHTVEDVDGQDVTKYQTRFIKGETTFISVYPRGKKRTWDRIDDLAGEVVVSEKLGKTWEHRLLEREPSIEQQKALAGLRCPFEERDHIPAGGQNLGTSWEVDATQIKRLLGSGVSAVSGKLKAEFVGLEEFLGDQWAVIRYDGTIRVRCEPEDVLLERTEVCELNLLTYRSPKNGITVKSIANMTIKTKGKLRVDDHDAEFAGSGRTVATYRASVEK